MNKSIVIAAVLTTSLVGACAYVVPEKQPTIAHVHIGHALTGWRPAPRSAGLFVTAEREADALLAYVNSLSETRSLSDIKLAMRNVEEIITPSDARRRTGPGLGFGLMPAYRQALSHIEFAASSADSSANVRDSVPHILEKGQSVSNNIAVASGLAEDLQSTTSLDEALALVEELKLVSREIRFGTTPCSVISGNQHGLCQMRAELAAMTAREVPPYAPVSERWLFGLVRLPSGEWEFQAPGLLREADGGGGGGGGGGGY